jgi:alcohol dehydrogenase/S-(hydroxymethyl)glutathione dehydrogenase/alcohol dehydrogenase
MKTRAAALFPGNPEWTVAEFDLAPPGPGEVLVRMKYAGLCHSDEHIRRGNFLGTTFVGGHEGAGIVEAVGANVPDLEVGDHVGCSWIPTCGRCYYCLRGKASLCDMGANMLTGELPSGGFRFSYNGEGVGAMAATGTFSEYAVLDHRSLVKVDKSFPLEWVSLVTCGVATGWGSVINAGAVKAGDRVAIYGCGGIGANAVAAAVHANADMVAVIDPQESKRAFATKLGADHVYATAQEAHADIWARTWGNGVDVAIVAVGNVDTEVINQAYDLTGKGGTVVLVSIADNPFDNTLQMSSTMLTIFGKRIVGTLYGDCHPRIHVPRLLEMAGHGKLDLAALISRTYSLDEINQGFADMHAGANIRGLIAY